MSTRAFRYCLHVRDTGTQYRYARVNIIAPCVAYMYDTHTVCAKKVAPPLKLSATFSLVVNL